MYIEKMTKANVVSHANERVNGQKLTSILWAVMLS